VLNYNVRLACSSPDVVRRVARRVSGRGGGLRGVEALALRYPVRSDGADAGSVWEVACNLTDAGASPPAVVLDEVTRLLREEVGAANGGVGGGSGYDELLESVGVFEPAAGAAAHGRVLRGYVIGMTAGGAEGVLQHTFDMVP
jgi:hypothetical protein